MARKRRRNPRLITTLPPRVASRLERQALTDARRINAPLIQAERRALKSNRRAFKQDKRSIRGVAAVTENAIDAAIKEAKQSGLKGQYLQQTLRELEARRAGITNYVQSERSLARQDLRSAQAETRGKIFDARAQMLSDAQTEYQGDYDTTLNDYQTAIKDRATRQRERRQDRRGPKLTEDQKTRKKETLLAVETGMGLFRAKPDLARDFLSPTASPEVYESFIEALASKESIGLAAARRAAKILREKRALLPLAP